MKHKVYSFSAISKFEHCPRQFYETAILKLHKFEPTVETEFGIAVHNALEVAVLKGTPLPANMKMFQPIVDEANKLVEKGWAVRTEASYGLTKDGHGYTGRDVFWNTNVVLGSIADLLCIKGTAAVVMDYKSGSNKHPDLDQLDVMALTTFVNFPEVQTVEGVLAFIIKGGMNTRSYTREADLERLRTIWVGKCSFIDEATRTTNFPNTKYTPLCGWCPCDGCENWERGQEYRRKRGK